MTLDHRHSGLGDPFPTRFAGSLVEAGDDELVLGRVEDGADVAIESDLELWVGCAADRARRAHLVTPDDRARVTKSGDRRLPLHELRLRYAPLQRKLAGIIDAASRNAAEARPVDTRARPRGRLR